MTENWERARQAVRRTLTAKQWNPAELAREAKTDIGTVLDFLNGNRKIQSKTQGKIEEALGWPPGTLLDIAREGLEIADLASMESAPARNLSVVPERVQPVEEDNAVLEAIRLDPYLLPEAKEHFTNQYALLRRIALTTDEALPYVAHGQREEPVDPVQEKVIEEIARRASEDNPHSPNGKK